MGLPLWCERVYVQSTDQLARREIPPFLSVVHIAVTEEWSTRGIADPPGCSCSDTFRNVPAGRGKFLRHLEAPNASIHRRDQRGTR